ncbi:syntaxin of plants 43 [Actinidia rufa]|uniref:Syntaxin of plants 43 n=1 Tax=Actinidia rufa TaxID=165716 RepID=A0A7J0EWE1_9ERIC|nr:syntaxin of plants 43 [Actinidia rufa]
MRERKSRTDTRGYSTAAITAGPCAAFKLQHGYYPEFTENSNSSAQTMASARKAVVFGRDCPELWRGVLLSLLSNDSSADVSALARKSEAFTAERRERSNTYDKDLASLAFSLVVESVNDLAQIMKDLSVLVIDQGTIVDKIDYNIQNVAASVVEGLKQLHKVLLNLYIFS